MQTVKERLVVEHSWKFAVPAMNRSDFLGSLLGFDKDRVNDEDVTPNPYSNPKSNPNPNP